VQKIKLLNGSVDYTSFTFTHPRRLLIEACKHPCPKKYDLQIEITTPNLEAMSASGGGTIESDRGFPGQDKLAAAVDGGGTLDLRSMSTANANAAVENGGQIRVTVMDTLSAAVDSGGLIEYWGNPAHLNEFVDGGEVRKGAGP
jgi:hypothetical protein